MMMMMMIMMRESGRNGKERTIRSSNKYLM